MGFGATEALIVLGIVLLIFGGKKLPELGGALGKSLTNFKKGLHSREDDETKEATASDQEKSHQKKI